MPGVIDIMNGEANKITPIKGMFSPLLIEDKSLDLIVASAAVHHADNLELLLHEMRLKLRDGGYLIILNETPSSSFRYFARLCFAFSKIFFKTLLKKYEITSQKISSSGFEYDPYLGDRSYPLWYWKEAISRSGFEIVEFIDTGLPTVKNTNEITLNHFICKAI
jgi:SAM-dependent methyltransferase